jgi:hypothetical protein
MKDARVSTMDHEDLGGRNRRVLRVLLTIMATLIVASLLVGVRW